MRDIKYQGIMYRSEKPEQDGIAVLEAVKAHQRRFNGLSPTIVAFGIGIDQSIIDTVLKIMGLHTGVKPQPREIWVGHIRKENDNE